METLLFGTVMLAIGWLVLWCCVDHSRPGNTCWPFDFRLNPTAGTRKPPSRWRRTNRDPEWNRRQKSSGS